MVLNKRRPVGLMPVPANLSDNVEVFVMKGTNEVFTDYEKYLQRFDWLNQRKFTDAVNGKTGLTYWDALESETRSSASIENVFAENLRAPILRKVQFSTISRMDELVNSVFEEFKHDFFPGEEVYVVIDEGDQNKGVIREKATFPMIRAADGTVQREPFARYFVRIAGTDSEEALVDGSHLRRDRKIFTKQNLRAFLKNSLQRESWIGAPWLVKEPLAIHYRLPMEIPVHLLQDAKLLANKQHMLQMRPPKGKRPKNLSEQEFLRFLQQGDIRPMQAPHLHPGHPHHASHMPPTNAVRAEPKLPPPPPPPKYPIEDLDLAPKRNGVTRPELKFLTEEMTQYIQAKHRSNFQFSGLDMKHTGMLLEIWNTLNVQAEVYVLDSFTFDDFVDAMNYSSVDTPCELFEEIHCAVLKLFVDEEGAIAVKDLPKVAEPAEDDSEMQDASEVTTPLPDDVPARSTRSRRSLIEQPSEIALSLVEDDKKVNRAAEMVGDRSWSDRLIARDFEDGGWQIIVIGILHQLLASPYHKEQCENILVKLAPESEKPTRETALVQYAHLDVNLRVEALQMLTLLSIRTDVVKEFLETCSDDMTDVRKRKIEHQRERKIAIDQLAAKDRERKIQLPDNMPQEPKPEATEVEMAEVTEDTIEVNGNGAHESEEDEHSTSRSLRRGNDRKRKREEEAARREKERAEKAEAAKAQSKLTKEFKKLLNEIEGLKKKISELENSIEECDNDLREANVQRTRVLGKDRFCNRYYWFERNGQPFAGLPSSSTAHYGYANGRIWVQGPDAMEREGFIDRTKEEQQEYQQRFQLTVFERRALEEGSTILNAAEEWGFIDDPVRLDSLIGWLDDRGDREKKLRKELTEWRDRIAQYMNTRRDFLAAEVAKKLEAEEENPARITTRHKVQEDNIAARERCLKWTNSMAARNLGHIHSRPVRPKTKRQKKSDVGVASGKGVAVVVGRNGKIPTRQGTNYNFK